MTSQYQLIIENRNSPDYKILDLLTDEFKELSIYPSREKLSHKDIFTFDSQENVKIINSPVGI